MPLRILSAADADERHHCYPPLLPRHALLGFLFHSAELARQLLASGLAVRALSARDKVKTHLEGYDAHPSGLVGQGTRAARIMHRELRDQPRAQAKRSMERRVPQGVCKPTSKAGRSWRRKHDVAREISRFPDFGAYTASSFWQLYRLQMPLIRGQKIRTSA